MEKVPATAKTQVSGEKSAFLSVKPVDVGIDIVDFTGLLVKHEPAVRHRLSGKDVVLGLGISDLRAYLVLPFFGRPSMFL